MTAVARPRLAFMAAFAGSLLLVARPVLPPVADDAKVTLALLFGALLVLGMGWPGAAVRPSGVVTVGAAGAAAFALARVLGGGQPPARLTLPILALSTLAAVAEEALFRRLLFTALLPAGAGIAVAGSTILFAIVHVTVYGWWVFPLDLAAGLVFSWQRWATGSWRVPAVTHVLANLLVVI